MQDYNEAKQTKHANISEGELVALLKKCNMIVVVTEKNLNEEIYNDVLELFQRHPVGTFTLDIYSKPKTDNGEQQPE